MKPGLLFSEDGNLFDLSDPIPMIDNIRMAKANPSGLPFKIGFYVFFGVVFLSALSFWPVRALIRKIRRDTTPAGGATIRIPRNPWLEGVRLLVWLGSLFSLFCLVCLALVPNLVYIPWPHPFIDLLWWQFALVGMPFANLLIGMGSILWMV